MGWDHDAAVFMGAAFLTNAIPHFVSGMMGRPFQTPFATPSGKGLSSSSVNVLWGFLNIVLGWMLTWRVGGFDPASPGDALLFGAGMLLISSLSARLFGRLHGGNTPDPT